MKRILIGFFVIVFITLVSSIESAQAYMVAVDFGFTVTNAWGYPFSVGDKGTGWFTYDNEIPGIIYDYPSPHHDTGYYQGDWLHVAMLDYVIYSGITEIGMLNDYVGEDHFGVGHQLVIGDSIDTRGGVFFIGPENTWDSLPLTLPIPDFDAFTVRRGQIWNYNYAQNGIIDRQVDFDMDYVKVAPVPEPATILLLGFGLSGLGLLRRRKA